MERRVLGMSGIEISRLGLGGLQFGYTADRAASFAVLDAYVEAGGNFIDTANLYSRWVSGHEGGESESVIREWLAERGNREGLIIATKVRGEMWHGRDGEGLGRDHIVRACEDSLRRLQVETIDVYQCHWADEKTPVEETLRAFEDLRRAGKIQVIGASNYDVGQLREALDVASATGLPEFVSLQAHYNLVHRAEFEGGLAQVCAEHSLAVLPYSPLGAGFLTGKYERGKDTKSKRATGVRKYMNERGWATVDAVRDVAEKRGVEPATVAIAWLLQRTGVTAPILGANSVEQLAPSLAALDMQLDAGEVATLDRVSDWRT